MTAHLADPEHNPSFTRGAFLGEIREDLVFPFPELSADERESLHAVLDSFRGWAAARANFFWIISKEPMGRPNCFLSFA